MLKYNALRICYPWENSCKMNFWVKNKLNSGVIECYSMRTCPTTRAIRYISDFRIEKSGNSGLLDLHNMESPLSKIRFTTIPWDVSNTCVLPHWMNEVSVTNRHASSSPDKYCGSIEQPRAKIVKSYRGKLGITGSCSQSALVTDPRATDKLPAAAS